MSVSLMKPSLRLGFSTASVSASTGTAQSAGPNSAAASGAARRQARAKVILMVDPFVGSSPALAALWGFVPLQDLHYSRELRILHSPRSLWKPGRQPGCAGPV